MKNQILNSLLVISVISGSQAWGYLDENAERGLQHFELLSPSGYSERCIIPKGILKDYREKDFKDLQNLCQISFYDFSETSETAICPKLYSTSPALEIDKIKLKKFNSRTEYEKNYCSTPDRPGKKIAKFKQGITCSYTPSLLAYYQVSTYLGRILHIPEVVLRTMDINEQRKQVKRAIPFAQDLYTKQDAIRWGWESGWPAALNNPGGSAKGYNGSWLFTKDFKGIYGALIENPRGEEKYTEVYGKGSYDTRYERLKRQIPYQRVASSKSIQELAPQNFEEGAQILIQMKDVSDMVIIDTLLSQQDRVGNIAYRNYAYYMVGKEVRSEKIDFEDDGSIEAKIIEKIQAEGPTSQIVTVKEMLLKDNDCGVAKSNMA
ncbi:MAG: hypothetical protein KDD22_08595, partial [Bdellovibrionales bacterium]|nr:hypothetical protein [Bdellovibrionales bacterium]